MATNTTKLGLIKPDLTDIVDIGDLNDNADDIDAAVGAAIVTSTTRPTSPWTGQIIYETDTNNTLVWDGTAWEAVSGAIAPGSITATELASDAVTTAKILDANVTTAKIADANVTSAKLGAGTILQVVSTAKTDTFTTTSASFTTVTGLTATITPRATSSKIVVLGQIAYGPHSGGTDTRMGAFKITRGGTDVYVGDAEGNRLQAVFGGRSNNRGDEVFSDSISFVDSPNSTSALTYQVEVRRNVSGAVFINRSSLNNNDADNVKGASSITLMEVAG
jgi:hypothetical protein